MPSRYYGFALAFALLAGPADAFAQPPNDDRSVLQTPLNGPDFLTVSRVDSDGTIVVAPSASVPATDPGQPECILRRGTLLARDQRWEADW